MGRKGVVAGVLVMMLAGCASAAGDTGAASEVAVPGVSVTGSLALGHAQSSDSDPREGCWEVTFDPGGGEVTVPLVAPPGFSETHAVMADPLRPGTDVSGAAVVDPGGSLVGIEGMLVAVSATFHALDEPGLSDMRETCGWLVPPLVATSLAVDPEGMPYVSLDCNDVVVGDEVARLCTPVAGTPAPPVVE